MDDFENLIPVSDTIKDNVNLIDEAFKLSFIKETYYEKAETKNFSAEVAKILINARYKSYYRYENTEEGLDELKHALASDLDSRGVFLVLMFLELNSENPNFTKLEGYTDTLLRTGTIDNTGSAGSKTANTPTGISASTDFVEEYTNIRQKTDNTNLETINTSDSRTISKESNLSHKLEMINKFSIKFREIVIKTFSRELVYLA